MAIEPAVPPRVVNIGLVILCCAIFGSAVVICRKFYFRSKVALLNPVRCDVYRAGNLEFLKTFEKKKKSKPLIVLVGDSRIQDWHLPDNAGAWDILNRGIGGETSAQLRWRIECDVLPFKPDFVVIQSGINDLVAASAPGFPTEVAVDQTKENLKRIAATCARSGARVFLTTVLPPGKADLLRRIVWNTAIYSSVVDINKDLLSWNAPEGVSVIDLGAAMDHPVIMPDYLLRDCMHLNPRGYESLNSLIVPSISMLISPPAAEASGPKGEHE